MAAIDNKRVAIEGIGFGVIAGVVFLAAQMLASAVTSAAPFDPLRWDASIVLGFHALDSSLGSTFLAGLAVHLVLSGVYGLLYAELEARLPAEPRRHYGIQAGIGVVFAALLWVINVAVIAHALLPWFVTAAPLTRLVMQAVFFGAPLGLMFTAAERRTPLVVRPAVG